MQGKADGDGDGQSVGDHKILRRTSATSVLSPPLRMDLHHEWELELPAARESFRKALERDPQHAVALLGGGGPERARVVCCFLGCDARPYNPLLTALPAAIHLSAAGPQATTGWLGTLLNIAACSSPPAGRRRPGGGGRRRRWLRVGSGVQPRVQEADGPGSGDEAEKCSLLDGERHVEVGLTFGWRDAQ